MSVAYNRVLKNQMETTLMQCMIIHPFHLHFYVIWLAFKTTSWASTFFKGFLLLLKGKQNLQKASQNPRHLDVKSSINESVLSRSDCYYKHYTHTYYSVTSLISRIGFLLGKEQNEIYFSIRLYSVRRAQIPFPSLQSSCILHLEIMKNLRIGMTQ